MPIKKTHATYFFLPDRQWLYRASLVMLVTLSALLLIMSKTNNPAVAGLRTHITDAVTPVLEVTASPMNAVHNAGVWLVELVHMHSENIALKNEKIELLKWQAQAKAMQAENESLRALLKVVPAKKSTYITSHIVSDLGGPYVHSALINSGSTQGIKKDEAVVSENGLMGRVMDVGTSSARILLLSDMNSHIPVIAEHAHEKSILVGNNTDVPTLSYLSADSKIKVGERIVTSGDGGIFPQGIPVGVVTSVTKGTVKVQPYVDASVVEYVSVIDYSF